MKTRIFKIILKAILLVIFIISLVGLIIGITNNEASLSMAKKGLIPFVSQEKAKEVMYLRECYEKQKTDFEEKCHEYAEYSLVHASDRSFCEDVAPMKIDVFLMKCNMVIAKVGFDNAMGKLGFKLIIFSIIIMLTTAIIYRSFKI